VLSKIRLREEIKLFVDLTEVCYEVAQSSFALRRWLLAEREVGGWHSPIVLEFLDFGTQRSEVQNVDDGSGRLEHIAYGDSAASYRCVIGDIAFEPLVLSEQLVLNCPLQFYLW